jgi:hypothetical protein
MTTFIRILAAFIGFLIFFVLWGVENWSLDIWLVTIFASLMIIYALIGHKLKGEGNLFTENFIQATKKDIDIINKKDKIK